MTAVSSVETFAKVIQSYDFYNRNMDERCGDVSSLNTQIKIRISERSFTQKQALEDLNLFLKLQEYAASLEELHDQINKAIQGYEKGFLDSRSIEIIRRDNSDADTDKIEKSQQVAQENIQILQKCLKRVEVVHEPMKRELEVTYDAKGRNGLGYYCYVCSKGREPGYTSVYDSAKQYLKSFTDLEKLSQTERDCAEDEVPPEAPLVEKQRGPVRTASGEELAEILGSKGEIPNQLDGESYSSRGIEEEGGVESGGDEEFKDAYGPKEQKLKRECSDESDPETTAGPAPSPHPRPLPPFRGIEQHELKRTHEPDPKTAAVSAPSQTKPPLPAARVSNPVQILEVKPGSKKGRGNTEQIQRPRTLLQVESRLTGKANS